MTDWRRFAIECGFFVLGRTGLAHAMAPWTRGYGIIFTMHRVLPPRSDLFQPNRGLEITPEFLRIAIKRIRKNGYRIVSLAEALSILKGDQPKERFAVLTFDDGYRDNLKNAYPVLKELNAPFTIFISSGLVDRTSELWWVALEQIIDRGGSVADLSGKKVGERASGSSGSEKAVARAKAHEFCRFMSWLRGVADEDEQRRAIRTLAAQYGVDLQGLADELIMSWDELRDLVRDPLVSIGGHTHTHRALGRLNKRAAEQEIQLGLERLKQELGFQPIHFAFPYGNMDSVSEREYSCLRAQGITAAVTTVPGTLDERSVERVMDLPRTSLNGFFQREGVVDQSLTGAPFVFCRALQAMRAMFLSRQDRFIVRDRRLVHDDEPLDRGGEGTGLSQCVSCVEDAKCLPSASSE